MERIPTCSLHLSLMHSPTHFRVDTTKQHPSFSLQRGGEGSHKHSIHGRIWSGPTASISERRSTDATLTFRSADLSHHNTICQTLFTGDSWKKKRVGATSSLREQRRLTCGLQHPPPGYASSTAARSCSHGRDRAGFAATVVVPPAPPPPPPLPADAALVPLLGDTLTSSI